MIDLEKLDWEKTLRQEMWEFEKEIRDQWSPKRTSQIVRNSDTHEQASNGCMLLWALRKRAILNDQINALEKIETELRIRSEKTLLTDPEDEPNKQG